MKNSVVKAHTSLLYARREGFISTQFNSLIQMRGRVPWKRMEEAGQDGMPNRQKTEGKCKAVTLECTIPKTRNILEFYERI